MPGGVTDDIGLRLDDAAADQAFRQLPQHQLADEGAGERCGVDRQFGAGIAGGTWASSPGARRQVIGSTHSAREAAGSNGSAKYWVSRATRPSRNSMMLTV